MGSCIYSEEALDYELLKIRSEMLQCFYTTCCGIVPMECKTPEMIGPNVTKWYSPCTDGSITSHLNSRPLVHICCIKNKAETAHFLSFTLILTFICHGLKHRVCPNMTHVMEILAQSPIFRVKFILENLNCSRRIQFWEFSHPPVTLIDHSSTTELILLLTKWLRSDTSLSPCLL